MIIIGTEVAIMSGTEYTKRFVGQVGIVKKIYKNKVGVKINGYSNPDSAYGLFWFDEDCVAVTSDNILLDDTVKQIIYNGPKTIIIWNDGSKTIVSCGKDDTFDIYAGFCAAVAKKMFGSTSKIKKIIANHIKENK